jgi:hypothetical protein
MPRTHPPYAAEYRRRIVELARGGRSITALAREFEPQWRRSASGSNRQNSMRVSRSRFSFDAHLDSPSLAATWAFRPSSAHIALTRPDGKRIRQLLMAERRAKSCA